MLNGLGFLQGSCCPHYDSEPDRKPACIDLITNGQALPGFALDDGTAVHFVDGRLKQAVTARPDAHSYQLLRQNNTVSEQVVPARCLALR